MRDWYIFYWYNIRPYETLVLYITIIYLVYIIVNFVISLYYKKSLIKAFIIEICDEISRTDVESVISRADKMHDTMSQFSIDGLSKLYAEQSSMLYDNNAEDGKTLYDASKSVIEYRDKVFKAFLGDRKVIRWALDGLDSLIGKNKSIEVAWSKGLRYLNKIATIDSKEDAPWFPTYMKLLGLPHNLHDESLQRKLSSARLRSYPTGYFSLYVACRYFNYMKYIRYFDLTGQDAYNEILKFKASPSKK